MTTVAHWFVAIAAAPSAPPVATNERVYVALRTGAIAAHALANGARLWSVDLAAEQPLAVDEMHVYVASADTLHALRNATGEVAWRVPAGRITAPPLVHAGWVVVAAENALVALRAVDGTRVWRHEIGATDQRPFIEGDALFCALADGRIVAVDLQSGTVQWERRLPGPLGEPFAAGDRLYLGSGDKYFNCLTTDSGSLSWRMRIGAEVRGRPAADAERVYFAALDNELRALDRRSGAMRWHRGVPFRPSAGPILLDDTVALPGPTAELRAFDAASGRPAKALAFPEPIVSAPAVLTAGDPAQLRIAAVTGGLKDDWKLAVFGPPAEPPAPLPVLPLTELPGAVLPPRI